MTAPSAEGVFLGPFRLVPARAMLAARKKVAHPRLLARDLG